MSATKAMLAWSSVRNPLVSMLCFLCLRQQWYYGTLITPQGWEFEAVVLLIGVGWDIAVKRECRRTCLQDARCHREARQALWGFVGGTIPERDHCRQLAVWPRQMLGKGPLCLVMAIAAAPNPKCPKQRFNTLRACR